MSGRGELNRAYEDTPVSAGSLMELAQIEGLLHASIKMEVETAFHREVSLVVVCFYIVVDMVRQSGSVVV